MYGSSVPPGSVPADSPPSLDEGRRPHQLDLVRQRVHGAVGVSARFSVSDEVGSPTRAAAAVARERGAELILVGLGPQGAAGRAVAENGLGELAWQERLRQPFRDDPLFHPGPSEGRRHELAVV